MALEDFTQSSVQKVILEQLRYGARERVGISVLEAMELNTFLDHATQSLVIQLATAVQAESICSERVEHTERVDFEAWVKQPVPASTWQYFKNQHATTWWLRWLVRRRPVRTVSLKHLGKTSQPVTLAVTWEGYATFPNSNYVTPDARLGYPVYILRTNYPEMRPHA